MLALLFCTNKVKCSQLLMALLHSITVPRVNTVRFFFLLNHFFFLAKLIRFISYTILFMICFSFVSILLHLLIH